MTALNVIPAKAGIQFLGFSWTPAFAGVTVYANSEIVTDHSSLTTDHYKIYRLKSSSFTMSWSFSWT
jgi:hypothetical protein